MQNSRSLAWLVAAWIAFLAFYAGVSHHLGEGASLSKFGNIVQCFVPLLANAGLLLNAGTPHWRRNVFWMLLALSCSMWMIGQFQWTYFEVYLHKDVPGLFAGDIIFFLRGIPLIAALGLRPYLRRGEMRAGLGYMDFALLLTWWTFLYVYSVLPWMYAEPLQANYDHNYNALANVQFTIIVMGFGLFWYRTKGAWRVVCAHLFGASALYTATSFIVNLAVEKNKYYTGSYYDLPLISVFFWYAIACLLYTSPSPRDGATSRMPSSA